MKQTTTRRIGPGNPSYDCGFTLVEILVVITIILVLAALSMVGINRMKFSAAQVTTMNQMRQIGTSAVAWGAENNQGEPFYVSNGTGDYSDEGKPGKNPALAPGNPAILLYNPEDLDQGYVTDHRLFYSPLVKMPAPERRDYIPRDVTNGKSWGTYVWYYPFSNNKTAKQQNASQQALASIQVARTLENRLLMMVDYSRSSPVWKNLNLAVLIDGSVRALTKEEIPSRLP